MQCPRCGSSKYVKIGRGVALIVMWLLAGFFTLAGNLFWWLWGMTFVLLITSPIALFIKPTYVCSNCKQKWKTDKAGNIVKQ